MTAITINGVEYDLEGLSENAKGNIASLQACDNKISQLETELAIVKTAKTAYGVALNGELPVNGAGPTSESNNPEPEDTH